MPVTVRAATVGETVHILNRVRFLFREDRATRLPDLYSSLMGWGR